MINKLFAIFKPGRFQGLAGIFLLIALLGWATACSSTARSHLRTPEAAPAQTSISVAAMGDLMLGTENLLPDDDGRSSFTEVLPFLQGRDIVFGNLEGPLTDRGQPAKVAVEGRSYVFRMPPRYVKYLKEAGFNMLSLANNHAGDYGLEGRAQTKRLLEENGIAHSGSHTGRAAEIMVRGTRVVMIDFCTNAGCLDLRDLDAAVLKVKAEAGRPGTLVIVSFHGGAEGSAYQRVPRGEEAFLGENRGDLRRFAKAMIDAGAALVIGHGPHVPRGLEFYNDRLIAYSLGNFCTARGINVRGVNGQAPLLLVELTPQGEFLKGQIVSFDQSAAHRPKLDAGHQAARNMDLLSRADFDQPPIMTADGYFQKPVKKQQP